MNISIAVVDNDRDYVNRLVEVLQDYNDLSLSVYTSLEALKQAFEVKRFDVILFDPDITEEKIKFSNAKLWICLYSDDSRNATRYQDGGMISKYQRISKIYKEIVRQYADCAGDLFGGNGTHVSELIGVFSPIGGCGKTTIALALASKLVASGSTVLFLSTEQLNSSSYFNEHSEDGITTLLGAVGKNSEKTNFELKLKSVVKKGLNGISYVEGFERIVDYMMVEKEEMQELIEKIRVNCGCDVVIFDMGSCIDNINQVVFGCADKLVIVEKYGELEAKKMDYFWQQAITYQNKERMCRIANFVDKNSNTMPSSEIPAVGTVRYYGKMPIQNILQAICTEADINVGCLVE